MFQSKDNLKRKGELDDGENFKVNQDPQDGFSGRYEHLAIQLQVE